MTDNDGKRNTQSWRSNQISIKDALSKSGTELMEISRPNVTATMSQQRSNNANSNAALSVSPSSSKNQAIAAALARPAVTIAAKNGVGKKTTKKLNGQESPAKMVYYQSTPLIVKTEQPSQAQFCTPLRTTTPTPTTTYSTGSTTSTMLPSPTVTLLHGGNGGGSGIGMNVGNYHHQQLLPLHAQQQNTITPTLTSLNYSMSQDNDTIILQQQQQHQQHQSQQATSITITNNSNQNLHQQQHQQQQNYLLTNIKQERLPPSISLYATKTAESPLQLTTSSIAATTTKTSNSTATTNRRGQNAGPKPQFKCEQCGMIFGSKSAHTSHVKSHAKAGEMSNVLGGGNSNGINATAASMSAQFNTLNETNETDMLVGIPKTPQITPNAAGGSDPYQCNVCQKTFAVPARLIRHYRTHTGERPFECEFCHKLFSVKENLQVHRRIHTKERPYKCDVCGRAFEHSGKLHRHMRIHTGERPHKCSVCQKTFIQSGQLVIHMRTHTGEKPYKCPVEGCGKGFTCSKQLKVHSRTHTGEKPYHCDICFRDFGYNHVLKLHRVQHYGSKCYKCTICEKTFKSKKEMEAHIKGHANEIPDDDEEGSVAAAAAVEELTSGQTSSISTTSSGGETTNSAPGSPQSPVATNVPTPAKTRKPRQPRTPRQVKPPPSPSSPSSTYSPPSSMASATRLSAGSPTSSVASPAPAAPTGYVGAPTIETDNQYNNSRDSGVATNFSASSINLRQSMPTHHAMLTQQGTPIAPNYANIDELPTDLSRTMANSNFSQHQSSLSPVPSAYSYMRQRSPAPSQTTNPLELEPTINPALLEAATIASEEEVTKAALQIMQLHRSSTSSNLQIPPSAYNAAYDVRHGIEQHDDEANELIEHYKRGDLARHGLHRRYAPVPKFESSLLNNEIIVRTVEAAIAPLRSSTESPERSSSPESDSLMLVADRDVMTLPLRKRKLYMNGEEHSAMVPLEQNANNGNATSDTNGSNQKVMRMSSVIQFAKAS